MSLTAWPDESELCTHLNGAGIPQTVFEGLDLVSALEEAVDVIEDRVGYKPFLNALRNVKTRRFDPPNGRTLQLRTGLFATEESPPVVKVGVTNDDAGDVLTEGEHYWFEPANAADEDKPYTRIRFARERFGPMRSISVQGVFGYGATLDRDIFNACIDYATHLLCPDLGGALRAYYAQEANANVKREKGVDYEVEYVVSAKYTDGDMSGLSQGSLNNFERVLNLKKYRRRRVGS